MLFAWAFSSFFHYVLRYLTLLYSKCGLLQASERIFQKLSTLYLESPGLQPHLFLSEGERDMFLKINHSLLLEAFSHPKFKKYCPVYSEIIAHYSDLLALLSQPNFLPELNECFLIIDTLAQSNRNIINIVRTIEVFKNFLVAALKFKKKQAKLI